MKRPSSRFSMPMSSLPALGHAGRPPGPAARGHEGDEVAFGACRCSRKLATACLARCAWNGVQVDVVEEDDERASGPVLGPLVGRDPRPAGTGVAEAAAGSSIVSKLDQRLRPRRPR